MRRCEGEYYEKGVYKEFHNGIFHGFFQEGAHDTDGGEYNPVAVIELEDGKVISTLISNMHFILTNQEKVERKALTPQEIIFKELLGKLGFKANLKGYECIKSALKYINQDENYLKSITKWLYPEVAKDCDSTFPKVERAIRHSILRAWTTNEKEFEEELHISKHCPTNGQFLAEVNDYIKSRVVC